LAVIDELIRDIVAGSPPGHVEGTRPIHSPGIATRGWFQATAVARDYTVAPHFQGQQVPVTVRFSNGTGSMTCPESTRDLVRGMAVKFHLGATAPVPETDMIGMTLPVFFVRTVDQFREFVKVAVAVPFKRRTRWQKIVDEVTLRFLPKEPGASETTTNIYAAFDYARHHPFAAPAILVMGMLDPPMSYSMCTYNTVHAFVLKAPDGTTRCVRFRWEPVDGVRVAPKPTPKYLDDELRQSLARNAVEFVLRMQVAEQGDDPTDPTTPWSQRRPRIVMGHLLIKDISPDQERDAERISFNPTRLVDGIAVSEDPTLLVRGPTYRRSAELRRELA
jgi:catalase